MEKYLLEEKDGTYAEIYCHNGNLVFDSVKAEILRLGVSKIWSLCRINGNFTLLYSDGENRFFAAVMEEGKIKGERQIFRNNTLEKCFAVPVSFGLKIYSSEKTAGGFLVSERTVSGRNASVKVLCRNAKNGRMKLFSSGECAFVACEKEKGILIINCETGEIAETDERTGDFSFFVVNEKAFCLYVTEKGVKLCCADKNKTEKTDVFRGGCRECALAFFNGKIYASAKDANKIYVRKCEVGDMNFSSMAQMPILEETEKITILCNNFCGEFFCGKDEINFIKSFSKQKKAEEKIPPENDAVKSMLESNISELSAQNKMLNMKINSMRENHILQTKEMEKEISRLKKENEVCKKAQKILENEIFRLNNVKEESDEHKIIDNDEKN